MIRISCRICIYSYPLRIKSGSFNYTSSKPKSLINCSMSTVLRSTFFELYFVFFLLIEPSELSEMLLRNCFWNFTASKTSWEMIAGWWSLKRYWLAPAPVTESPVYFLFERIWSMYRLFHFSLPVGVEIFRLLSSLIMLTILCPSRLKWGFLWFFVRLEV